MSACPPYERMREDFVIKGMTYAEMAAAYGVSSASAVHRTFKRRAQQRGEWPLHRFQPPKLWFGPVSTVAYVPLSMAARFAPHTRVRYRRRNGTLTVDRGRDYFPDPAPRFHAEGCGYVTRRGPVFAIPITEAQEWGYEPCRACLDEHSLEPKPKTRRARTRPGPVPHERGGGDQRVDAAPRSRQAGQLPPFAVLA